MIAVLCIMSLIYKNRRFNGEFILIKGIIDPELKIVIIYSPSYCSILFILYTKIDIFDEQSHSAIQQLQTGQTL